MKRSFNYHRLIIETGFSTKESSSGENIGQVRIFGSIGTDKQSRFCLREEGLQLRIGKRLDRVIGMSGVFKEVCLWLDFVQTSESSESSASSLPTLDDEKYLKIFSTEKRCKHN